MLARCLSASLLGIDARPVTVEVDLAPGLPGLHLVGLADTAIQESRERVRSALRNSGFRGPLVKVVVNLAPADLRKEGPCFDLPIALGLLIASGQLDSPCLQDLWSAGELGLDGRLRPCRGILAIACLGDSSGIAEGSGEPPPRWRLGADPGTAPTPNPKRSMRCCKAIRGTSTSESAGPASGPPGTGPRGCRRPSPVDGGSSRVRQDPACAAIARPAATSRRC